MAVPAAVLLRVRQVGLGIRLAQVLRKATMAVMALLMQARMLVAAVAVRAQQAQLQQIRTAATVEMARLHPFPVRP
jgi:Kef-type K+ transport system membrane component KefB